MSTHLVPPQARRDFHMQSITRLEDAAALGLLPTLLFAGAASAQLTGGESSHIWACFYECKAGPDVQQEQTFQEVTSLMITNQGRGTETATLFYLDGNQNFIGRSDLNLSTLDLDEVSVCHTLLQAGQPPSAGLVEIVSGNSPTLPSGIKAWVKNVGGKFFHSNPEVFEGRVSSLGKTKCEPVPSPEINDQDTIQSAGASAPILPAILIEDTGDSALPDLVPVPDVIGSFCRLEVGTGNLLVEVLNQGSAAAGATTTSVDFLAAGFQSQATPALAPSASTILSFPIPPACYDPNCDFRIIVDSAGVEVESNEANNLVLDSCLG